MKIIDTLRNAFVTHQELDDAERYIKQLELDATRYRWLKKYTSQLLMVTEQQTDEQIDIARGKKND
jgi:hypothetical protein